MQFAEMYLAETALTIKGLVWSVIEQCVDELVAVRQRQGRVFVLGNGGSAANASHFVNDLRKIAGIEAYAPTDNVAELTARTNDDGWGYVFSEWLKTSRLSENDLVFVLSVGGGWFTTSVNITNALGVAAQTRAPVIGIVGRNGGFTAQMATVVVMVPTVDDGRITPHVEETQSILTHLIVSHPKLCPA